MDTKTNQINDSAGAKEVNISINGEPDTTNVKRMDQDTCARAGLTKEELMKYADEPFWVRLRNILFATFWIVWISILVAAVGYVIKSPGCVVASAQAINGTNSASGAGSTTG